VLEEYGRVELQTIRWQIAASPLEASNVIARFQELERAQRKEKGMDGLMERLAREKREREAVN